MFTGIQAGGQLMLTTLVENYPGFVDGLDGPPLMEAFQKQAQRFGTEMIAEDVTSVDFSKRPFRVTAGDTTLEAHSVIIATGATAKLLGLPSESALMGRGVSTCATCDGFFFKDQNIMVVGGGDSAMEEALYLSRLGKKVELVHRREQFRASKIMQERAMKNPKISFTLDTVVEDVLDPSQGKVTVGAAPQSQDRRPVGDAGGWVLRGHRPRAQHRHLPRSDRAPREQLRQGGAGTTKTSVLGVFAAGDVQDFTYRQAVTAAGSGCMAALEAERYLERQRPRPLGCTSLGEGSG
jgi:thioredoxin reductase (NADPH)